MRSLFSVIDSTVGYEQVSHGSDARIHSFSQAVLDTVRNIQKSTFDIIGEKFSLYELGDSLATCETNLETY